jgi:hypothetical protein
MNVQGVCQVNAIDDEYTIRRLRSPGGKPFLRLTFEDGVVLDITTNLAEMIGGIGAGLRQREEDKRAN